MKEKHNFTLKNNIKSIRLIKIDDGNRKIINWLNNK